MKNTRTRDVATSNESLKLAGYGKLVVLAGLLALLLLACNSDGGEERDQERVVAQATIVVSTVGPESAEATPLPPTESPAPTATPTPPAPLAALVNGQYIFLADYERQVAQYEQALTDLGVDLDTADGQARLEQARQDVLDSLIDDVLIEQVAPDLGVNLSEDDLAAQIAADIESGGGEAAFQEWLQATGLDQEDYRRMLRQSLLVQRVWDAVTSDVPTEAEQLHVRHIVVDSEESAQQILAQLQNGADFVSLAREQSLDTATNENGGDLGWFPRGVIAPELEEAAFGLQPGEVSEAIPLGEQFFIIQVVEREVARPLSDELSMHLKQTRFERWLADLRASAVIERFVAE
jgi:parvulin-like peptidyl-prolyl isomerase